jgi:eukaryotic-like serine/threonine-protein kinase
MRAETLERFDVTREVGRGAAGIVFRAVDRQSQAPVALKVIASPDPDEEMRARFLDEGELLSHIDHPGIVRIVAYGTLGPRTVELAGQVFQPETPFIAMEWLEGEDLSRRHSERRLSLPESLECGRQVASALGAAHAQGIVHRDVKPSNVFLVQPPKEGASRMFVKLLDFGVACEAQHMTALGPMVGTPAYMAPEQARGDTTMDPRCDVYSLGATLFELISGRPPHIGPSPIATMAKLVSTPAQRLSELLLEVPDALDDLLAEMLELEWQARPYAVDVQERLRALVADPALPELANAMDSQRESVQSSVSRLVTTMVALHAGKGAAREEQMRAMRERGAEAVRLGKDSIVAYLGARRAHGGEAAVAIELGRKLIKQGACVGVATGRALVDLARPAGEVVDKASALAREAASGQLFADETTAELARSSYEFTRGPTSSWLVGGEVADRRQRAEQTPFVGRGAELEQLFAAYERSFDTRQPVVVSVSGPPGIGKSRLAREFLKRLDEYRHSLPPVTEPSVGVRADELGADTQVRARVVRARCEAYGRSRALGTAADALIDLLRIPKGASSAEVSAALAPLGLVHDESGLLASLLAGEEFRSDVDPHRARDILYLAMTELMLAATRAEPCVLVLEDLQWSDPESVAWFDHLLSRASGNPLMLLVLARPSFWKDNPGRFTERDHVRVELRPIPRRATMEIARALIGCEKDDPKLGQIAKQAAGSPLFAEELARVIAAGKSASSVPTIEAAIQVSLDSLDDRARDALVNMSVFGLSAWDKGLQAVGVADAAESVERLLEGEMVVEQALSRFSGTREVWFKHALVRDVAYASASDATRKELHAKVASWLAGVGEDAATIAEHYELGGQSVRAAGYWEVAARRALAANALRDAVKMADRALTFARDDKDAFARAMLLDEIYSRLDERASEREEAIEAMAEHAYDESCEVRTMGARARYDHARSASAHDVEERLREVVARSAELDMLDEQARCLATLATRYAYAGELTLAEKGSRQLLELADERGMQSAAVDAWQALAVVRQTRGELAAAMEARRNAARAARAAGLKQREAMLTINLGFALTTIGAKDEARREIEAGIGMAEEIGSAGTVRLGRMLLLGWAAHFGADPSLDGPLAEPRESADEAATGAWIVKDRVTLGVLFYRGCELLNRGDRAALGRARSLLKMSAEAYRQTENRDLLPVALGHWAEAERRLGQLEAAAKIAQEAADLVEAGAPSLLNEGIIYLALHGARVGLGDLVGADRAIERGMPALLRRVRGLRGTEYERAFLSLSHNALLLEAADAHACLPEELEPMLE